jgi:pyrroloquinoline quinone (PQQ) biosynthesis protein C
MELPGVRKSLVIDELRELARGHVAVHHPYLRALADGELPDPARAVRELAYNYFAYSSNFQRYLTGAISQLRESWHRQILLQNLSEEIGHLSEPDVGALAEAGLDPEWVDGYPHPQLFERLLDALGMDWRWRNAHPFAPEARAWSQLFLTCCQQGGAARAIGALGPGTECIVAEVYRPIVVAIERHLDVAPRDAVFFALHCAVDDDHGAALRSVAADLSDQSQNRAELQSGVEEALFLRAAFFDAMHRRALAMTPVGD